MTRRFLPRSLRLAFAGTLAAALPVLAQGQTAAPVTTSSGLVYTSVVEGKGASPTAADTVKVHYRGTFPDGKEFDSSYSRNAPPTFIFCTPSVQHGMTRPSGKVAGALRE